MAVVESKEISAWTLNEGVIVVLACADLDPVSLLTHLEPLVDDDDSAGPRFDSAFYVDLDETVTFANLVERDRVTNDYAPLAEILVTRLVDFAVALVSVPAPCSAWSRSRVR